MIHVLVRCCVFPEINRDATKRWHTDIILSLYIKKI